MPKARLRPKSCFHKPPAMFTNTPRLPKTGKNVNEKLLLA